MHKRIDAILLPFLLAAASPEAAEYFVDAGRGDDAAAGTAEAPFRTIGKGVEALAPGDTVTIRGGVYRESVTVSARGTAERPIAIRAAADERVVLSGGRVIDGWQPATAEQVGAAVPTEGIYTVLLDWHPFADGVGRNVNLFEDGHPNAIARTPNEGWWPAAGVTETTISDARHLTQAADPRTPEHPAAFDIGRKGSRVRYPVDDRPVVHPDRVRSVVIAQGGDVRDLPPPPGGSIKHPQDRGLIRTTAAAGRLLTGRVDHAGAIRTFGRGVEDAEGRVPLIRVDRKRVARPRRRCGGAG
jgi:hypothetical protein